jgi:hypothetical protein
MPEKIKSQQTASAIITFIALAVICLATYLTLSHSALSVKINLWQARVMGDGKYFPALTIFFLALPPLLLLLLIKIIFFRLPGKNK